MKNNKKMLCLALALVLLLAAFYGMRQGNCFFSRRQMFRYADKALQIEEDEQREIFSVQAYTAQIDQEIILRSGRNNMSLVHVRKTNLPLAEQLIGTDLLLCYDLFPEKAQKMYAGVMFTYTDGISVMRIYGRVPDEKVKTLKIRGGQTEEDADDLFELSVNDPKYFRQGEFGNDFLTETCALNRMNILYFYGYAENGTLLWAQPIKI